mgnify:CR=1 FL=1
MRSVIECPKTVRIFVDNLYHNAKLLLVDDRKEFSKMEHVVKPYQDGRVRRK